MSRARGDALGSEPPSIRGGGGVDVDEIEIDALAMAVADELRARKTREAWAESAPLREEASVTMGPQAAPNPGAVRAPAEARRAEAPRAPEGATPAR
jgi:hypothetical protein